MSRVNVKYAPAIKDLTVGSAVEDDEGMEAVLCSMHQRQSKSGSSSDDDSGSQKAFMTAYEKPEDVELLGTIRNKDWSRLMRRVETHPHVAFVKFSGRDSLSKGNSVLHEVCKNNPTVDIIETLIDANESAITLKGNGGSLPLHYACATGASTEVIQYLVSNYPEAVSTTEDNERALPLHFACKIGVSEDAFMLLLTHYPQGAAIRDYFGRLPLEYAKNIQCDVTRRVAIECLNRAKWLQKATHFSKKRTESDFQRRVRGYEESQARHLKMIQEVHEEEIAELENIVKSQKLELSKTQKTLVELEEEFQNKIEEHEKDLESLTKLRVSLDLKTAKIAELTQTLEETQDQNNNLSKELEVRNSEYEIALEDVEMLNKHSEWLESIVTSIRDIASAEAPIVKSLHQRDDQPSYCSSSVSNSTPHMSSSSQQRYLAKPSSKKFLSGIPTYGNRFNGGGMMDLSMSVSICKTTPQFEDNVTIVESRSEASDSDLMSAAPPRE
jgi:hypothetical protein